jgi:hypothetical protein
MATITTTITIDNVDGEQKTITGVCSLTSDYIYTGKQKLGTTFETLATSVPGARTMILKNTSATNDMAVNVIYNGTANEVVFNVPAGQIMVIPYTWYSATNTVILVDAIQAAASDTTVDVEYCIIY